MLGDLSYDLNTDNGNVGNEFMEFISPITSKLPFMISAGNHESYDYNHYVKRFNMPQKKEHDNLYFSFDINNIHFVSIVSEMGLNKDKHFTQDDLDRFTTWFNKDLENTDKKWKIVYMHRPIYCSNFSANRCNGEAILLRNFYEKLFNNNKIDLVIGGHLHNYERLLPVYEGHADVDSVSSNKKTYTNPKYPVYLICGSTGNKEGHTKKCIYNS